MKKCWAYSKSKQQSNNYPVLIKLGDTKTTGSEQIANLFASHFKAIVAEQVVGGHYNGNSLINQSSLSIAPFVIPDAKILAHLLNCDSNKRGGPDGIPYIFLKNCAPSLASPLCLIFNSECTNEKCVKMRLLNHCHPLIASCQHGFLPTKSIISNLFNFTSFIATVVNRAYVRFGFVTRMSRKYQMHKIIILRNCQKSP